jgi:hypothetical protein
MAKQGKCTKCKIRYFWKVDRKNVKCPVHHTPLKTTSQLSKLRPVEIKEYGKPPKRDYKPNMKDYYDCKKVQRLDTMMIGDKAHFMIVYDVQTHCPPCKHYKNCLGGITADAANQAVGITNKIIKENF